MKKTIALLLIMLLPCAVFASQEMGQIRPIALDSDSDLVDSCRYFFECGTTTEISTYTTAALSVANSNPLQASSGEYGPAYFEGCTKVVQAPPDEDGDCYAYADATADWTVDNWYGMGSTPADGVNLSDYTDIAAAITAIGETTTTLWLDDAGTQSMDENVTIPATLSTIGMKGCIITTTGYTLTINGPLVGVPGLFTGSGTVTHGGPVVGAEDMWNMSGTVNINDSLEAPLVRIFTGGGTYLIANSLTYQIPVQWWGVLGDGSTANITTLQACFDDVGTAGGGHVVFPDTGSDYLIAGAVFVLSNTVVEFLGQGSFLKLTGTTTGGTLSCKADETNITFINPMVDANNITSGGSGNVCLGMGVGNGEVKVFGGILKNAAMGTSYQDGGKCIQCEGGNTRLTMTGTTLDNCAVGLSARRDATTDPSTGGIHVMYDDIHCRDCDTFGYWKVANTTSNEGEEFSVKLNNFTCHDCGTSASWDDHIFQFSRAANVTITSGTISGGTAVDAIFAGRGNKIMVDDVTINQDATAIIDLDPPNFAQSLSDQTASANWYFDITATGTYGFVYYSDTTESTYSNRALNYSTIIARLSNDVSTSIVDPVTREGDTFLQVTLDDQILMSRANIINANYAKMANVPALGHTITELNLVIPRSTELTIAAGVITRTGGCHTVDTAANGASDDLDTISGGDQGDILVLYAENAARTVVLKDGVGNLLLSGNCTLDNTSDIAVLHFDGTNWREIVCTDNG